MHRSARLYNYNAQLFSGLGITENTPLLLLGFFNLVTVPGNLFNGLSSSPSAAAASSSPAAAASWSASPRSRSGYALRRDGSANCVGLGFGVFFIFAYVAFYSSCLDATMYLVPLEIFPMVTRSSGMGFSIMGQFAAIVILLGAAPAAFQDIGYRF